MNVGVITARKGSKSIANKNLVLIGGKKLIEYSYEAAINSNLDLIIISTNDDKIIELFEPKLINNDKLKLDKRPNYLCTDTSPSIDTVLYLVKKYKINKDDFITLLQPTSPFILSKHINEALEEIERSESTSLFSIKETPHSSNPNKIMRIINGKIVGGNSFQRKQDCDIYYQRNGAIYISNVKNLTLNKSFFSDKNGYIIMNKLESIDIDDGDDLTLAKALINYKSNE